MDSNLELIPFFYLGLFISLSVLGLLFFLLRKKVKENKALAESLEESTNQDKGQLSSYKSNNTGISVKNFLDREAEFTKNLLITEQKKEVRRNPTALRSLSLRLNLLKAEMTALIDDGEEPSDLKHIHQYINDFLKNAPWMDIISKTAQITEQKSIAFIQEDVQRNTEKLKRHILVQKETINQLREQAKNQDIGNLTDLLNDIEQQCEPPQIKILEQQFAETNEQYAELEKTLNSVNTNDSQSLSTSTESSEREKSDTAKAALKFMLDELRTKYDSSLGEIEVLRQANNDKRRTLLKLDVELAKQLENDGGNNLADSNELISLVDSLKLQLRDSEMCTAILESETESLREKIEAMTESDEEVPTQDVNSTSADNIDDDATNHMPLILKSLSKLSKTKDYDGIEKALINICNEAKLTIGILLKTSNSKRWIDIGNVLDDEAKKIIKAMELNNIGSWADIPQGSILSLKNCCCLIKESNNVLNNREINQIFEVTSGAISRINTQHQHEKQRKFLISLTQKTKDSIQTLEVKNKYVAEEGKKAVDTLIDDMNSFSDTIGLTDLQKSLYSEIQEDFKRRLELVMLNRISLDESYVELINLLDERIDK